jgi:hypothetical protein
MNKIKQWTKDHKQDLILGVTVGTILGVVAGLIANKHLEPRVEYLTMGSGVSYEENKKAWSSLYDWFSEQEHEEKNFIVPLDDDRFVTIDMHKANELDQFLDKF